MKNITKSIRYMALAAAALPMSLSLLTSCSNDRDEELLVRNEVKFTTAISESVQSRADEASTPADYTPADGSLLDVYYGSLGATQKGTYTYSDKGWIATAPLYWDGLDASDEGYTFYAVAPAGDYGAVQADQSSEAHFTASDLLVARSTVTAKNTPVAFTLKHVLSQLVVNVKTSTDDNALKDEELASTTVTIGGLQTAYTLADGTTADAPATDGTAADAPATAVATGDPATGLQAYKVDNAHRFIAPAQTLDDDALTFTFTVTIGGSVATYLYTAPATTLAAGTITAFSITIKKTGVTLGGITLTDWSTGKEQKVDVNYASIQVGTIAGAAEGDKLTLNLLDESPAVAATATYTYTKTSADDAETPTYAWISEAPLYWNEIANDGTYSGTFTALYEAADGTWSTGWVDKVAHGGAPSFNSLTQAMAKMTITLVGGDGISDDVDTEVTGRIVTLQKSTATPAVGTDGKPAKITLGDAQSIEFANGKAFAVAPQDIGDDNVVTLTRANGNTYTLALNTLTDAFGSELKVEAGKHYQLTITVNDAAVAISATIAPWTDVTGSGTVTPDFQ